MSKTIGKQKKKKNDTATDGLDDNKRASKGIDIALAHGVIEMIDQVKFFKVGSQTDPNKKYLVKEIHQPKTTREISYSCSCPDYENHFIKGETKHECKHIIAVQFARQYDLTLEEVKTDTWVTDQYDF